MPKEDKRMTNGRRGDGYSKDLVDIVKFAVTILILVLVVVWLLILLALGGVTTWPQVETNRVLFFLSISIALICALLWLSHHLKIIILTTQTETRIWLTLIAGILAATVTAVDRMYKG